jgi:hypothetical protein
MSSLYLDDENVYINIALEMYSLQGFKFCL